VVEAGWNLSAVAYTTTLLIAGDLLLAELRNGAQLMASDSLHPCHMVTRPSFNKGCSWAHAAVVDVLSGGRTEMKLVNACRRCS
jgi:hypothetical protein